MMPLGQLNKTAGLFVFLFLGLTGCAAVSPGVGDVAGTGSVDRGRPAIGGAADAQPPIQPTATYRVKPGDTLFVHVFDNPDLSQNVIVGPDGRIFYPLAGGLKVKGLSLDTIDRLLTARLASSLLQPEVTVKLAELGRERVFVTGEVISPGVFDVTGQISVVQAISMAGGFTAFADRSNVIVYNPVRARNARRVFDYEAFLADPAAYDFALRPGDTVIVR